jgi:hypothetical protein
MTRYEIQVAGHIEARWARALGAETCRLLPEGRSVLLVTAVDAAATYGLIARLRDAGLELVSFTPSPVPSPDGAPAPETAATQNLGDRRPEARDASR